MYLLLTGDAVTGACDWRRFDELRRRWALEWRLRIVSTIIFFVNIDFVNIVFLIFIANSVFLIFIVNTVCVTIIVNIAFVILIVNIVFVIFIVNTIIYHYFLCRLSTSVSRLQNKMQKCPKQPIGEPDGWVRSTSWGRERGERRTVCSTDRVLTPTSDDDRANYDGDEEESDDYGEEDNEDGEDDNEDADIFLMQTI